jgi:hypothetical protein
MDHQVHNHSDIGTTTTVATGSNRFYKLGTSQVRLHSCPGWIEAFDMAGLKNTAVAAGHLHQTLGLIGGAGQRLFYQSMDASSEQCTGNFVVRNGWSGYDSRIDLADQLMIVGDAGQGQLLGDQLT